MDASWMEPKPKARQAIESWTPATDDMRRVVVLGATVKEEVA